MILGSTGSIGVQALDLVARSEDLQVVGMAAAGRCETGLLLDSVTPAGVTDAVRRLEGMRIDPAVCRRYSMRGCPCPPSPRAAPASARSTGPAQPMSRPPPSS